MRKSSGAVAIMISAIAAYFVLVWGFDGLRVVTSSTYGLEDVWRSQVVFGIGSMFGLDPDALVRLAVFFGVMKLTVAGVCAVHLIDRARSAFFGKADTEIFQAGLIVVAILSLAGAIPALWTHNVELVREQTVQLLLVGLATALCVVERTDLVTAAAEEPAKRKIVVWHPEWYTPWRR